MTGKWTGPGATVLQHAARHCQHNCVVGRDMHTRVSSQTAGSTGHLTEKLSESRDATLCLEEYHRVINDVVGRDMFNCVVPELLAVDKEPERRFHNNQHTFIAWSTK